MFRDPNLEISSDYDYTSVNLTAPKDYEEIPKCRNMITDSMMRWLMKEVATTGPGSSTTVIVDWIVLRKYTGF